jgi:tryptophan synthase alpha chain
MPVGVGFGIRDGDRRARIAAVADAVVIGSRIIEEIESARRREAAARVHHDFRRAACGCRNGRRKPA